LAHVLCQVLQGPHITILILGIVGDVTGSCTGHGFTCMMQQQCVTDGAPPDKACDMQP
jgi:hypothetical protein